jgi:hypothetical protein
MPVLNNLGKGECMSCSLMVNWSDLQEDSNGDPICSDCISKLEDREQDYQRDLEIDRQVDLKRDEDYESRI